MDRTLQDRILADSLPSWNLLRADRQGMIWAGQVLPFGAGSLQVDVFSPDGTYVAAVTLPPACASALRLRGPAPGSGHRRWRRRVGARVRGDSVVRCAPLGGRFLLRRGIPAGHHKASTAKSARNRRRMVQRARGRDVVIREEGSLDWTRPKQLPPEHRKRIHESLAHTVPGDALGSTRPFLHRQPVGAGSGGCDSRHGRRRPHKGAHRRGVGGVWKVRLSAWRPTRSDSFASTESTWAPTGWS